MAEAGFINKGVAPPVNFLVFLFVENVFVLAVFHLAHVDDTVGTLNDNVDLCGWFCGLAPPGIMERGDAIDAKCPLDLRNVRHANPLISQAHPSVHFRRVDVMRPVLRFHFSSVDEGQIKQAEKVAKLVDGVFGFDLCFHFLKE